MCDDQGRAGTSEGYAGRMGATMFDSCGPMMKHMFRAFHEATEGAAKSSPAEAAGATDPGGSTTEQGATAGGARRRHGQQLRALHRVPCPRGPKGSGSTAPGSA